MYQRSFRVLVLFKNAIYVHFIIECKELFIIGFFTDCVGSADEFVTDCLVVYFTEVVAETG
jgi:hypothetical protein